MNESLCSVYSNDSPAGGDIEASEYRAVFSYEPSTQGDLKFREGETVLVYWADENGWWYGSAGSAQGWFPGSYVEVW